MQCAYFSEKLNIGSRNNVVIKIYIFDDVIVVSHASCPRDGMTIVCILSAVLPTTLEQTQRS